MINILLTKSFRIFLKDIFYTIVVFCGFALKKPSFQIYMRKKSFVTLNLKCIRCKKKLHILTKSTILYEQKLKWWKMYILKKIEIKIIKHFAEKSFSVFGGLTCNFPNTLEEKLNTPTWFFVIFSKKNMKLYLKK